MCITGFKKSFVQAVIVGVGCFFNLNCHAIDFVQILDQAVRTDAQIATLTISKSTSQDRNERAKRWLNLNGSLGFNTLYNTTYYSGVLDSQAIRQIYRSNALNISITQPIYNPLRSFNIEESALQSDFESAQIILTRNELALRLVQVMLEIVSAGLNAESFGNDLQLINQALQILSDKSSPDEVLGYKIRFVQTEGQRSAAIRLQQQKKQEIFRLLGSTELPQHLSFNLLNHPLSQIHEQRLDEIIAFAESNSMVLRSQQIMVDLADAMVKRTSMERYPSVDLIGNAFHSIGAPLFPNSRNELIMVGVQAHMPFGTSGVINNFRSEALLQQSRAKNEIEFQRKIIQQNISDVFYEYANLRNQLNVEGLILNMRSAKKKIEDSSLDEMYVKLNQLEDDIAKEQSRREISRIQRELFLNVVKLWSLSGSLDERRLRLIGQHFN